jgi:propionyl-CoA synthetase
MLRAVNIQVRNDVGAIATLGGLVCARLPKTRSGFVSSRSRLPPTDGWMMSRKTLRRTVKDLVENASLGKYDAPAAFPPTIEDVTAVDDARLHINEYFIKEGKTEMRMKAKL